MSAQKENLMLLESSKKPMLSRLFVVFKHAIQRDFKKQLMQPRSLITLFMQKRQSKHYVIEIKLNSFLYKLRW